MEPKMSHQTYKISGIPVLFPCKPYPSQFCMMDRIIKGIERRQHCLLESPTGSGKSLALLCSSLAWLLEEKAKKEQEDQAEFDKGICSCVCHSAQNASNEEFSVDQNRLKDDTLLKDELPNKGDAGPIVINLADDNDDFKDDNIQFNTKSSEKKGQRHHISLSYEDDKMCEQRQDAKQGSPSLAKIAVRPEEPSHSCQDCSCSAESPVHRKIPKIFFGTRTHKQVAQIVKELKKTEYSDIKMTILASREHTCIHGTVSKMKSKNDGCKELLNGPGCVLKDKAQRYMSHQVIKGQGLANAWDLEDLMTMCKPRRVCPYFLSRGLKEDADLIICPYNYLVDPLIREAMMLSLKGHIVILDEAHNIEDSAREAASQTVGQDSISAAIKDMQELMQSNNLADYSKLVHVLTKLEAFIEENKYNLEQKDFNQSYKIWSGFHIVAQLDIMGMGPKHFPALKAALTSIQGDSEERKEKALREGWNPDNFEMKPTTQSVLEQLFMVMDFLYRQEMKYVDDYRASLVQSVNYVPRHEDSQWLNSRKKFGGRNTVPVDVLNLNFWCMNPAVAFSDFVDTRSVILTSGTLSPMASFQSELGLDFKIQLEANHVIKDSQVWVGSLGQGPSGTSLMAVYRNLESFAFQDELGCLVNRVCQIVPHGVLCFLPSYKVLDKLYTRWECTGLLNRIGERKRILREPRSSRKEDFEEQILSYYTAVENIEPDDTIDGAIMFAVCRGKISEGLDFADNFARAVISVGIPYPNFKDIQVELKRKYNDQHRQDRGLMSGSDWYEIQAFRALNQALGRCIRHRNDWGALIVVDERFVKSAPKYTKGLSKWVRSKICSHDNFSTGMESLKEFIQKQKNAEQEQTNDTSLVATPVAPKLLSVAQPDADDKVINLVEDKEDQKKSPKTTFVGPAQTPNAKFFSIFNSCSPLVKGSLSSKTSKMSKLNHSTSSPAKTSTSLPSSLTTLTTANKIGASSSHQLPTAVVHPSFVLPPKPLASISNFMGDVVSDTTAHTVNQVPFDVQRESHNQHTRNLKGHDISHHHPSHKQVNGNSASSLQKNSSSPHWKNGTAPNSNANTGTSSVKVNPASIRSRLLLKVVMEKAPPGKRTDVFEIPPELHSIFGGNLNLPVSATERLVYLVEAPRSPGGQPLARIIKMSEEDKDRLMQSQRSSQSKTEADSADLVRNLFPGPQNELNCISDNVNPIAKNNKNDHLDNKHVSEETSSKSLIPNSNDSKAGDNTLACNGNCLGNVSVTSTSKCNEMNNCFPNSMNDRSYNTNLLKGKGGKEEEYNSSGSLFDSPATPTVTNPPTTPDIVQSSDTIPVKPPSQTDSSPVSNTPSPCTPNAKKCGNPLLKFLSLSGKRNRPSSVSHFSVKNPVPCEAVNDSEHVDISAQTKTNLTYTNESPPKSTTRNPHFKSNTEPRKTIDTDTSSISVCDSNLSENQSNCDEKIAGHVKCDDTAISDNEDIIASSIEKNNDKTNTVFVCDSAKKHNVRYAVSKRLSLETSDLKSPPSAATAKRDGDCGRAESEPGESSGKKKQGKKRRSLSGKSEQQSESKKCKALAQDEQRKEKAICERQFCCIHCGSSLSQDPVTAGHTRQKIPTFVRHYLGDVAGDCLDCLFFASSPPFETLISPPPQGKIELNYKFVEEEDVCIQFLYCCHCLKQDLSPRPAAVRVRMTTSASTRFVKGQLWLLCSSLSPTKSV